MEKEPPTYQRITNAHVSVIHILQPVVAPLGLSDSSSVVMLQSRRMAAGVSVTLERQTET